MKKIGKYTVLLLSALLSFTALAEDSVQVMATVDRNQVFVGNTLTLTLSVTSQSNVNLQEPRLPDLSDFDFLNSWSSSQTSSTYTNGVFRVERTRQFNYLLAPKKIGQIVIPPFSIEVSGQDYKTKPIRITVIDGANQKNQARPQRRQQQQPLDPFDQAQQEMDDIFNQMLRRHSRPFGQSAPQQALPGQPPANFDPEDEYFIDVVVDKKNAYVGEQVMVSWYFYTRNNLTNIQNIKYPDLKGFWKEDIDVVTNLNYTNEIIDGLVYKKALLASYALFPIKAGKAKIDSYKVKCKFRLPGLLGFRETDYITKGSRTVAINVLPLPEQGKTSSFTGAVGQFNIQAELDQTKIKANEPVTFKVKFSGRGNAKRIDLPELSLPEGVEEYDTKSEAQYNKDGSSFKSYEILLIPRKEGQITLPAMDFTFFNPQKKAYYTKSTPEFKLEVAPGDKKQLLADSRFEGEDLVAPPAKETYPPLILAWSASSQFTSLQRAIAYTAVALLMILFFVWRYLVEFGVFDKSQTVDAEVKKRIQKLIKLSQKGNWREVGIEGGNLIYYLLGEYSGQGGASRQATQLLDGCPPSVRRQVGEEVLKTLKVFEQLGFAPEAVNQGLKDQKNLKSMISDLEKLCKKVVKATTSE